MSKHPISSWQFAFPPSAHSVVWARYHSLYFRSADHGATWAPVPLEGTRGGGLASHPFSADTLLLSGHGTIAIYYDGVLTAHTASGWPSAVHVVISARDMFWGFRYVST